MWTWARTDACNVLSKLGNPIIHHGLLVLASQVDVHLPLWGHEHELALMFNVQAR